MPRWRRGLALGRLDAPAPPRAIELLTAALDDADSETRMSAIWALGSLKEGTVVTRIEQQYGSDDAGIRKMAVYSLGAIPEASQSKVLETALNDPAPDVQWNAAVALARHGRREAVPTLRRMLDRAYLEQSVQGHVEADVDTDPAGDVMISGIQAAAALRESTLREPMESISREDKNMKVRQAALEALKVIGA
jgi:HEAT repeat protein